MLTATAAAAARRVPFSHQRLRLLQARAEGLPTVVVAAVVRPRVRRLTVHVTSPTVLADVPKRHRLFDGPRVVNLRVRPHRKRRDTCTRVMHARGVTRVHE